MNKTLTTILIIIAVLAVAVGIFFAGSMVGRANVFGFRMTLAPGASAGVNGGNGMGPGMMGRNSGMMNRYGYNNANIQPRQASRREIHQVTQPQWA